MRPSESSMFVMSMPLNLFGDLDLERWRVSENNSAWVPNIKNKTKRQPQSLAWGAKCSCPANEILKWATMPP